MLSNPGGPFVNVARLNVDKYGAQPAVAKPLFEYLFYHEGNFRNFWFFLKFLGENNRISNIQETWEWPYNWLLLLQRLQTSRIGTGKHNLETAIIGMKAICERWHSGRALTLWKTPRSRVRISWLHWNVSPCQTGNYLSCSEGVQRSPAGSGHVYCLIVAGSIPTVRPTTTAVFSWAKYITVQLELASPSPKFFVPRDLETFGKILSSFPSPKLLFLNFPVPKSFVCPRANSTCNIWCNYWVHHRWPVGARKFGMQYCFLVSWYSFYWNAKQKNSLNYNIWLKQFCRLGLYRDAEKQFLSALKEEQNIDNILSLGKVKGNF